MSNAPERLPSLLQRNLILAFAPTAMFTIAFVAVPDAGADGLAIGDQLTLSELARPDRFGWPAVFTCRRHPGDRNPALVAADNPEEMNERLLAAGLWPEDCHGGFSLRSTQPHPGKLGNIEGRVERAPSDAGTGPSAVRNR
jgi:hypothetical protein